MENLYDALATNMAYENGISFETASELVAWLDTEGVLDYDILKEVYSEPASNEVKLHLVNTLETNDVATA